MFDLTKPVQTRDGRKARIICADLNSKYSIAAAVDCGKEEVVWRYTTDGRYYVNQTNDLDLVNVTEKRSAWVCITDANDFDRVFREKSDAELHARAYRVKEIRELTYEVLA